MCAEIRSLGAGFWDFFVLGTAGLGRAASSVLLESEHD
jgi:hypothetical protein